MESWPVQVLVTVRERDCGVGEVLDESSLLVMFREARRAYISVLNAADNFFRYRLWDARLRVLRVVSIDDELAVRVRCDELGEGSFRMRYLVRDRTSDEVVAEGSSVQVLVDESGRDLVLPDKFRQRVMALEGRSFPRPS